MPQRAPRTGAGVAQNMIDSTAAVGKICHVMDFYPISRGNHVRAYRSANSVPRLLHLSFVVLVPIYRSRKHQTETRIGRKHIEELRARSEREAQVPPSVAGTPRPVLVVRASKPQNLLKIHREGLSFLLSPHAFRSFRRSSRAYQSNTQDFQRS